MCVSDLRCEKTLVLHTGQRVRAIAGDSRCSFPSADTRVWSNQRSIQAAWKMCEQDRRRVTTGGAKSSRHTAQVAVGFALGMRGLLALSRSNKETMSRPSPVCASDKRLWLTEARIVETTASNVTTQTTAMRKKSTKVAEMTIDADIRSVGA